LETWFQPNTVATPTKSRRKTKIILDSTILEAQTDNLSAPAFGSAFQIRMKSKNGKKFEGREIQIEL
jgi:hypothetical protein